MDPIENILGEEIKMLKKDLVFAKKVFDEEGAKSIQARLDGLL